MQRFDEALAEFELLAETCEEGRWRCGALLKRMLRNAERTVIFGAIGLWAVAASGYGVDVMLLPAIVFALGISAYGWVANAVTIRS